MPQVEVITRGDRRRVWTLEQKREIVAESLEFGADADGSGAQARHQQRPAVWLATEAAQWPEDAFAAVSRPALPRWRSRRRTLTGPILKPSSSDVLSRPPGLIEILLPRNVTLRVDAQVDGPALRRVLAALTGR